MTSISKNVYVAKIDDMLNKYNNTYHSTIEMKAFDIKSDTYVNSSKEINDKNPKFEIGYIVTISKYKKIFAKGYVPNWSEEVFVIKNLKILFLGHMLFVILKVKKLLEGFTKVNYKKEIKKCRKGKKRKGYKL